MEISNLYRIKLSQLTKSQQNQLITILSEYYLSPEKLFQYLLTTNNYVYLNELDDEIIGFFMVGIDEFTDRIFYHLGQCCVTKKHIGKNVSIRLYKKQYEDFIELQLNSKSQIITYATTASRTIFYQSFKIYNSVSPKMNGNFTPKDLASLKQLLNWKNWDSCDTHPFVIRALSKTSRYIKNESIKQDDSFFHNLSLDETNGDRLILILNS